MQILKTKVEDEVVLVVVLHLHLPSGEAAKHHNNDDNLLVKIVLPIDHKVRLMVVEHLIQQ